MRRRARARTDPTYTYLLHVAGGEPAARRVPRHRHPVPVRQLRRRLGRVRRRSTTTAARCSGARCATRGQTFARTGDPGWPPVPAATGVRPRDARVVADPLRAPARRPRAVAAPTRRATSRRAAAAAARARARRRAVGRRARRARPLRRGARSSRRATGRVPPATRPSAPAVERQAAERHLPAGDGRDPRRDLVAVERLRSGEVQRPVGGRRRPAPPTATAAMSRGSIHAILPGAGRQHERPPATASPCLSSTDSRRTTAAGSSRRQATPRAARSIARWLPCRPVSSPAIGMLETFTIALDARGARPPRSRWSRARPDPASATTTRNMRSTPAHARRASRVAQIGEDDIARRRAIAIGSGRRASARTSTSSPHHVQPSAHLHRRAHPSHRSRAPSRSQSLADTVMAVRLPRPGPGIGHELTVPQELACALRILAHEGWRENLSGHITCGRRPTAACGATRGASGGTRCAPPTSSRLDADGDDRRRRVGRDARRLPAHRAAPRARRRGRRRAQPSVLRRRCSSTMGELPRMVHQNSCIFDGELAFVDEYGGRRATRTTASGSPQQVGDASGILLAHHGAIVTGADRSARRATRRSRSSACAASPTTRSRPAASPVEIPRRARAELKAAAAAEHAAARTGTARCACSSRDEPEVLDSDRAHVARTISRATSTSAAARAGGSTITWLPEPEPRERAYTVISVDDHVVEPPDAFTGRFPKKYADEEPRVVPTDDGGEAWMWQGQLLPNVGFNAVVGPPVDGVRLRAHPLRRDAPRRLGRRRTRRRHGHRRRRGRRSASRRSCPASSASGSRSGPTTTSSRSSRSRAYNDWHLDAWCGAHPGRFIPNQIAYLRDPAGRGRRDPAQRGARLQGGDVLRGARQARAADDPLRLLGSAVRRVRGDRAPCCACTSARRARRRRPRPTRRPRSPRCCSARTACTARSTGSTRRSPCASPTSRSACRRAASAGWPASSTGSTTATSTSSATCRRGATSSSSPSEVLRRNFWFCALDDDSGMLAAPPHRRRAHPRRVRLPARRLVVAQHAGDARAPAARPGRARRTRPSASRWQNASELFRAPGARRRVTGDRHDRGASSPRNARERPDGDRVRRGGVGRRR